METITSTLRNSEFTYFYIGMCRISYQISQNTKLVSLPMSAFGYTYICLLQQISYTKRLSVLIWPEVELNVLSTLCNT